MNAVADELVGGFSRGRTYREAAYCLAAFPIGVTSFAAVTSLISTGASLVMVVIGVVIIALTLAGALLVGRADAGFTNRMIDASVEVPGFVRPQGGWWRATLAMLGSGAAWKAVVWFVARLPLGVLGLMAVALPPMIAWSLAWAATGGLLYDAAPTWRAVALAGAAAAVLLWPHAIRGTASLHATVARGLLGVSAETRVREAEARTARAETRTDLARELHDSVGHSMTAAVLQASAARRMLSTDPAYADRALEAIEQQGRAALDELDRVLAVMRDDGPSAAAAVGVGDIRALVDTARGVGQPVEFAQHGAVDGAPAGVVRDAYRVVQESLTNAMRHAAGAPTRVDVASDGRAMRVRVANDAGRSVEPSRPGGGRGLPGLAERIRAVGGTFEAGPAGGGGFEVRAEIPYGGARA